jgi:hypothetical protein
MSMVLLHTIDPPAGGDAEARAGVSAYSEWAEIPEIPDPRPGKSQTRVDHWAGKGCALREESLAFDRVGRGVFRGLWGGSGGPKPGVNQHGRPAARWAAGFGVDLTRSGSCRGWRRLGAGDPVIDAHRVGPVRKDYGAVASFPAAPTFGVLLQEYDEALNGFDAAPLVGRTDPRIGRKRSLVGRWG